LKSEVDYTTHIKSTRVVKIPTTAMDLSQFLHVSCDVGDEPIIPSLTEEDIVVIDEPAVVAAVGRPSAAGKRRTSASNGEVRAPPAKKAKSANGGGRRGGSTSGQLSSRTTTVNRKTVANNSLLSQQAVGILNSANLTVKKIASSAGGAAATAAKTGVNPITWKYRQLTENLYNGDIKKADLLKDYEPEKCVCKEPAEGEPACGEGCINRSTFAECDRQLCVFGDRCGNQMIQRRQYAPGLERFMTAKKGWGVRARQSISPGTLILEYMGELCTAGEFESRMVTRYKGDTHHYCLAMDSKTVIDAQRAGSECRFVNHSCDPNCEMQKWNVNGLYRMAVFAKRDILPGDEITYDYNFSLFDANQGQECKCGAVDCRGVIGGKGKDFLITVNDEELLGKSSANSGTASPGSRKVSVATDPTGQVAVDEKWFRARLTDEEHTWMQKNAPKFHQLEAKSIKCTVCNQALNFKVPGQIQRHPELGVIMCNKCRKNYGKGGWERDPEGNDEFCRWCSQGGNIYLCDFCPKAFCDKCLKWNLGRKYVKTIEEEEKWKCLLCDSSTIKVARAEYWAVHQYHKDKNAKMAKSNRGRKPGSASGVRPVPGIRPIHRNGHITTVDNKGRTIIVKNPSNNTPTRLVPQQIRVPVVNGDAARYKKHFVDSMLLEAERTANKMRCMINELRKSWYQNSKRDEKMVATATKKIREIFITTRANLTTADTKVIEIYRTNLEDADIRDIEPDDITENEDKRLETEEKIFSKSSVVVNNDDEKIECVETVPDLPFPLDDDEASPSPSTAAVASAVDPLNEEAVDDVEAVEAVEVVSDDASVTDDANDSKATNTKENGKDKEDVILDVSVDELEVAGDAIDNSKTIDPLLLNDESNVVDTDDLEQNGIVENDNSVTDDKPYISVEDEEMSVEAGENNEPIVIPVDNEEENQTEVKEIDDVEMVSSESDHMAESSNFVNKDTEKLDVDNTPSIEEEERDSDEDNSRQHQPKSNTEPSEDSDEHHPIDKVEEAPQRNDDSEDNASYATNDDELTNSIDESVNDVAAEKQTQFVDTNSEGAFIKQNGDMDDNIEQLSDYHKDGEHQASSDTNGDVTNIDDQDSLNPSLLPHSQSPTKDKSKDLCVDSTSDTRSGNDENKENAENLGKNSAAAAGETCNSQQEGDVEN